MNFLYYWRRIDGTLLLTIVALASLGILIIGSATHVNDAAYAGRFDFVLRQGTFFLLGFAVSAFFMRYATGSCTAGCRCCMR